MPAPIQNISLEFDPYIPWTRGVLRGIEEFAREIPEWRLLRHRMIPGSRIWLKDAAKRIDGLISTGEKEWAEKTGIPLARFGSGNPEPGFPVVDVDYIEVGHLAGENLIGNGYPALAMLESNDGRQHENEREEGFRIVAEAKGMTVHTLPLGVSNARGILNSSVAAKALIRSIASLEKPLGIFARNLTEVYILHSLLREGGFRIPDEVGLIVGGNDREMLDALQPPVTSISRNSYEIGYRAAEALHGLLSGQNVEFHIVVRPSGVVDRGSTRLQAIGDVVVQRARTLIRQRIDEPFNVDRLARELGVSGRSLRRRFQSVLRHSPVREVQLARIENAKNLLSNSRANVLEIAQRCGFAESCQLSSFFKKETGMTPTEYRSQSTRTKV